MTKVRRTSSNHDVHTKLLEARFDQLKQMITDLASNERYEDVLQGIVRSTMRAVIAGGAILALEARAGMPTKGLLRGANGVGSGLVGRRLLARSWARRGPSRSR